MRTKQTQSTKSVAHTGKKKSSPKETNDAKPKSDYWDRIADDPASGYTDEDNKNEDDVLNIDQEPGDNERGDDES